LELARDIQNRISVGGETSISITWNKNVSMGIKKICISQHS
jgi:hypothetical protein